MVRVPTNRITTHPGTLLREQIREIGLSVNSVARDVNLPATRLHEIIHERRGVTAKTAIALGAYFGQTPEFWMNAQTAHALSKGTGRARSEHPRADPASCRGSGTPLTQVRVRSAIDS